MVINEEFKLNVGTRLRELRNKNKLTINELIEKLAALPADAEKNVIASVSEEFAISDDSELSIVKVDGSKIDNLAGNTDFAAAQSDIGSLETDVGEIQSTLAGVANTLSSLSSDLTKTKSDLSDLTGRVAQNELDIVELYKMLTWQDLQE
jgi:flagellin-like hook-associated protein FlgL